MLVARAECRVPICLDVPGVRREALLLELLLLEGLTRGQSGQ
jgi:hypothetical protein